MLSRLLASHRNLPDVWGEGSLFAFSGLIGYSLGWLLVPVGLFLAVVVIRYETTATARWALLFIVRAFFNDTITVAVWTGFHVCASWGCYHTSAIYIRWRFAEPAMAEAFGKEFTG